MTHFPDNAGISSDPSQLARQIESVLEGGGVRRAFLANDARRLLDSTHAKVFDHPRLVLGFSGQRHHRIVVDGVIRQIAIGPGDALWTAPDCEMELHYVDAADVLHFNLCAGFTLFKPASYRPAPGRPRQKIFNYLAPLVVRVPGDLDARARAIAEVLSDPESTRFPDAYAVGLINCMLWHIHRLLASPPQAPAGKANLTWQALCAYIEEHFHESINRESTAQAFRINPNHVSRLFRQFSHQSFTEYLTGRRLRSAERLLLGSPWLTVKEVAARCGFTSAKHFNRVFRQAHGQPPTAYRATGKPG